MSETDGYCEDMVRRLDGDRYLATVFAPRALRPHLFALYAFNIEVARAAEAATQPITAQIRLQWWREAMAEIYEGRVREHPVARAVADAVRAHGLPRAFFDALIDAHDVDFEAEPFADLAAMAAYGDATAGNIMRLALCVLGAGARCDDAVRSAGAAQAIVGLLRNFRFAAARGRLLLPLAAFAVRGVDHAAATAPPAQPGLHDVIADVAARAVDELRRVGRVPREFLPALLPAASVPLYARVFTRPGFDPFREIVDVPRHRKQFAMMRAMVRGRL